MLMPSVKPLGELENASEFIARHIGISEADETHMLSVIGEASRRALIDSIVPRSIARSAGMQLPPATTEAAALAELKAIAQKNKLYRNFIGQGYYGTHTPGVILRNILENPAWYTAYTPYQAEISQGRMEALVNFQTMVTDLTGMAIANASMLDEATAAAEAMTLAKRSVKAKGNTIVVGGDCHPQTIEVIQTRAKPLGLTVKLANSAAEWAEALQGDDYFAVLAQYPSTSGRIDDLRADVQTVHAKQAAFIVAADLLALTLLVPPGEFDADIVVGTTQRFGMPMGAGGPHAAYMACRDEYKRSLPGRLVGVSVDAHGNPAYRLALQTREQHIRREKATSNICTAQVLPAVVASMYAVYHGPQGLKRIAQRVASYTAVLARGLQQLGWTLTSDSAFDTLTVKAGDQATAIMAKALSKGANLRLSWGEYVSMSLDETTTREDIALLWSVFAKDAQALQHLRKGRGAADPGRAATHQRLYDAPGVRQPPQRDRHAALHPQSVRQGPGAGPQHDSAGIVHHEAQRHQRDDPHHLAGIRGRAPLRPGRPAAGLQGTGRAAAGLVVPGHGLRRHQPAAQRWLSR